MPGASNRLALDRVSVSKVLRHVGMYSLRDSSQIRHDRLFNFCDPRSPTEDKGGSLIGEGHFSPEAAKDPPDDRGR